MSRFAVYFVQKRERTMYCGSNKTALASQKQIADVFIDLLRHRDYPSISISSICKEAGVSRQTFYSIFESKENIIVYELNERHLFRPGESCCEEAISLEELCREYSSYIVDKQEFLSLLVRNDVIYLMHDCLYNSFMTCSQFNPGKPDPSRAFAAEFFAGGLTGIAKTYVQQGGGMTAEQLDEMIYRLFSGQMMG